MFDKCRLINNRKKGIRNYQVPLLPINYEYRTRNETIRANSPVASARANPRIAYVNSCPRSAGFRAVDEIRDEKIDPIPIPAPVSPIAARPAPTYFAAAIIFIIF